MRETRLFGRSRHNASEFQGFPRARKVAPITLLLRQRYRHLILTGSYNSKESLESPASYIQEHPLPTEAVFLRVRAV